MNLFFFMIPMFGVNFKTWGTLEGCGSELTRVNEDKLQKSGVYNHNHFKTQNTINTILKSNGGHHTLDSNITDNGTTITLGSNTNVTGVLSATTFAGVISGSSQVLGGTGIVSSSIQIDGLGFLKVEGDSVISGSTFASPSQGNLNAVINGNTQSIDLGLQTTDDVTFGSIDVTNGSVDIRNTSPTLIIRNTDTTVI